MTTNDRKQAFNVSYELSYLDVKDIDLTVSGADENGMSLKEVFSFEVDKIRSSVSNYKSHKDLVKKEKQLEKDAHLSKVVTVDALLYLAY